VLSLQSPKNESTFIIMQQFSDTATAITRSSSVQLFTEAFILVLNIFIFILIVNATIHRIQDLMFVSPVGGAANRFSEVTVNQMKLLRAMVLLLLSPRALYTAFLAATGVLYDAACLGICNSSCMDQLSLLRNWLEFSPEFRVLVVGVCRPFLCSSSFGSRTEQLPSSDTVVSFLHCMCLLVATTRSC
jgi:hypothetical protein